MEAIQNGASTGGRFDGLCIAQGEDTKGNEVPEEADTCSGDICVGNNGGGAPLTVCSSCTAHIHISVAYKVSGCCGGRSSSQVS